jgi:hypothetical protein
MAKFRIGLVMIGICLMLTGTAGCQGHNGEPSGTTRNESGSVFDLLDIQNDVIRSIEIVNMGNGRSETVIDREQIDRIMKRLARVQIMSKMGQLGYTLTGYSLTWVLGEQTGVREIQIQVDVTQGDDFAAFGGIFYQVDDRDSDELNDYFALAKYEYR